jgi:tetratricopeptide (TPR) repeat protein
VLGVLASLVDKSLVEAAAGERSVRYRMLETVKAYSAEQLAASGELDKVRQAHTQYFADLVRQGSKELRTGAQLQWIARFDADNENLLDALRTAVDLRDADTAVGLVSVLGEYWNMRGRPAEAVTWFEAALGVPGPTDPLVRALTLMMYSLGTLSSGGDVAVSFPKAIRGLAKVRLLSRQHREVAEAGVGRFTNAVWAAVRRDKATCFRELEEARTHDDPWTRNMAVMMSAMFRENEGDVEQMAADLAIALAGFRALGDRWGTSLALRGLASYQGTRGDHEGARDSLVEALQLTGELGTTEGVSQLLAQCALSRAELGDEEGALQDLQRSRRLAEETGSRGGEGMAMAGLGVLARRAGRLDEALELVEAAYAMLDLKAERVAPHGQAVMLAQLSRVWVARADLAKAREHSRQAVELALATDDMPVAAGIVESLADVELLAGDAVLGAHTLGLAAAMRGIQAIPDSDVRRSHDRLREALGDDGFEAAYATGAELTRDEATAELRERTAPA